jgi:hypothetical protein
MSSSLWLAFRAGNALANIIGSQPRAPLRTSPERMYGNLRRAPNAMQTELGSAGAPSDRGERGNIEQAGARRPSLWRASLAGEPAPTIASGGRRGCRCCRCCRSGSSLDRLPSSAFRPGAVVEIRSLPVGKAGGVDGVAMQRFRLEHAAGLGPRGGRRGDFPSHERRNSGVHARA